MSLLAKLKKHGEKVREEQATRRFDDNPDTFKPPEGDSAIRILPHWDADRRSDGESFFFVRRMIHFIPQQKSDGSGTYNGPIACRQMFGKPCHACKAVEKLRKAKLKQKAGDIKATERYLYNIIDYGEKGSREPAVMVYTAPPSIHAEILAWLDDLNEEFWDLKAGRDWKLTKSVDKKKGAQFGTRYKIKPSLQPSAVPSKMLKGLDDKLTNLDEMWNKDEEKLMKAGLKILGIKLDGSVEEDDDEEDDDDEDDRRPSKKKASKDDDDDEEDDDEDDRRPKPKSKAKPADDDDEEEEEDEEPAPKPKKKLKAAPPPDDDDEEEEEEEEPKPKAKVKAKAKPEPEEEDDDDEEEEPKPKAKKKAKAEPEEEEDEAPKKFKRKAKKADDEEDLDDELKRLGV